MDYVFVPAEYQAGYASASSLIDTYGAGYVWNRMVPAAIRSRSWATGWRTAVGVALEQRQQD